MKSFTIFDLSNQQKQSKMKLTKKQIEGLNNKIDNYYFNNRIDNGYAKFTLKKGVLSLNCNFYTYADIAYYDSKTGEEVPMTGRYVHDFYSVEDVIENFECEIKYALREKFYFTMKELHSII
jgi:hypothetical protein